jgi:gliding motility-associated protein GldL
MSGNSFLESKGFKSFMAKLYGIGAAVVIAGALFKIMHWPFANLMLIIGMSTEVLIFLVSAFEPPHKEWDWSLAYPELAGMEPSEKKDEKSGTVTQQLDKMLSEAKVGPELIGSLGTGLKSLSDNVGEMAQLSNATVATNEFASQATKAAKTFEDISNSSEGVKNSLDSFSGGLSTTVANLSAIEGDTVAMKDQLGKLNNNLDNLNKVYGNMLSAMGGKTSA